MESKEFPTMTLEQAQKYMETFPGAGIIDSHNNKFAMAKIGKMALGRIIDDIYGNEVDINKIPNSGIRFPVLIEDSNPEKYNLELVHPSANTKYHVSRAGEFSKEADSEMMNFRALDKSRLTQLDGELVYLKIMEAICGLRMVGEEPVEIRLTSFLANVLHETLFSTIGNEGPTGDIKCHGEKLLDFVDRIIALPHSDDSFTTDSGEKFTLESCRILTRNTVINADAVGRHLGYEGPQVCLIFGSWDYRLTYSDEECSECHQHDIGQQGEYPCKKCGLPATWGSDDPWVAFARTGKMPQGDTDTDPNVAPEPGPDDRRHQG